MDLYVDDRFVASIQGKVPEPQDDVVDVVSFEGRLFHVIEWTDERMVVSEEPATPRRPTKPNADRIRILEIVKPAPDPTGERAPATPTPDELHRWFEEGAPGE